MSTAAEALAEIEYASVGIVTLAYRAVDARDLPPGSGFLVPPSEARLTKGATFASRKWGWLADGAPDLVVLRSSIGRYGTVDDLQRDDKDLIRTVAADIAAATGLDSEPIEGSVTRWGGGLPQYTVGHLDRVAPVAPQSPSCRGSRCAAPRTTASASRRASPAAAAAAADGAARRTIGTSGSMDGMSRPRRRRKPKARDLNEVIRYTLWSVFKLQRRSPTTARPIAARGRRSCSTSSPPRTSSSAARTTSPACAPTPTS